MSSDSAEKIQIGCPYCGKHLMVPLSALGKTGRCPGCQEMFPLQAEPSAPSPAPAAAPPVVRKPPVSGSPSGFGQPPLAAAPVPPAAMPNAVPPQIGPQQVGMQQVGPSYGTHPTQATFQQPDPSAWVPQPTTTSNKPSRSHNRSKGGGVAQICGGLFMIAVSIGLFVLGQMNGRFIRFTFVLAAFGVGSLISGISSLNSR